MTKRVVIVAAVLLCSAFAFGAEEVLYQIDTLPSGKLIAKGEPVLKGANYHYRQYPTGTLVSVKKSSVKQIFKLTPEQAAAANPMNQVTRIRDLAMQGPKSSGVGGRAPSNMGRARDAVSAANSGTSARTANPREY